MVRSWLLRAVALGAGFLATARVSSAAAPARAYTVFWQSDTSLRSGLDAFYACLTEGSSFSTTWANQFGVSSVSYRGSFVLTSKLPATVKLETDLQVVMTDAFDKGLLSPPVSGSLTEYLLYIPSSTIVSDNTGSIYCQNTIDPCGVHQQASYKGVPYQYAAVPLNCTCHDPPAPSKLDDSARVGEHELAEGLADLGTAKYEVGDDCKTPRETIACCGQTYEIQPLAGPNGIAVCQRITENGSPAACAMDGGAGSSGGSSGSDAGNGAGGASGSSSGGGAGGSNRDAGASGLGGAGGSTGSVAGTGGTVGSGPAPDASAGTTGGASTGTTSSGGSTSSTGGAGGAAITTSGQGGTLGTTSGAGGLAGSSGSGGSQPKTNDSGATADSTGGCSCRIGAGGQGERRRSSSHLFAFLTLSCLIASRRRRSVGYSQQTDRSIR